MRAEVPPRSALIRSQKINRKFHSERVFTESRLLTRHLFLLAFHPRGVLKC